MSNEMNTLDKAGWDAQIERFLQDRLQTKLDKLESDDPHRDTVTASFVRDVWVEDAAKRVQQIQAVTHSLKPIHPDARGTNLYVEPAQLPVLSELGSHALSTTFSADVVGNAAALDVYKFLKLQVSGKSLLSALLTEDTAAIQALHHEPSQARALRDAFVSLTSARSGGSSSHSRAKQLYWLTGKDACDDAHYVLLAPLYATSLAHAVFDEIQEHRFGEANKAARKSRREREVHEGVFHDYPDLAVQKMGGTKPQNISQLNSERGGVNYLLSSLPPTGMRGSIQLPVNAESVFDRMFISRREVRRTIRALRKFLTSEPAPNKTTREQRQTMLDVLVDELVSLACELQQLHAPGWTKDKDRFANLSIEEKLWLDPLRSELPEEAEFAQLWLQMEWPAAIGKRFSQWLNQQLKGQLPVGDAEAREWAKALLADEDGFKHQLRELRDRLDTPHFIALDQKSSAKGVRA